MTIRRWIQRDKRLTNDFVYAFIGWVRQRKADLFAILGILLFIIQLVYFSHSQLPVLDEGLYLYKGLLYVTGQYTPFQDYGPLTYQMPLAFFIPGTLQFLFGSSLTIGRYFAILVSLLMILGLWLTSRRLSNPLLATGAVWVVTLSFAAARMYSMAISEGLVACLLIWVMALALGEGRRLWKLILGSVLAGVILMIRIDFFPLLPLLCLYVLWQHGRRYAFWSALACLLPIVIIHALYWPNILRMWAYWLPESLVPFLQPWRAPAGAIPSWNPVTSTAGRLTSFIDAIRFYYVPIVGAISTWILWPRKSNWKNLTLYRIAVFLSVLFFSMLVLFIWASLVQIQDTCINCFPIYISFIACVGILLVAVSVTSWRTELERWQEIIAVLGIITILSLLTIRFIPDQFIETVMKLPVPRMRSMHFLPGKAELWRVISNMFHLDTKVVSEIFSYVIPVLIGALICGVLLLATRYLQRLVKRVPSNTTPAASLLIVLVIAGGILSPTPWLGSGFHRYDCNADVLKTDEIIGETLQNTIPPQAKIFWRGVSPETLLYLPHARIFPAQLDGDYAFKLGGDDDALVRYGWWDKSLGIKWLGEADYILVAQKYYNGWLSDTLKSGDYREISIFPGALKTNSPSCLDNMFLHIFLGINK